jgi:hypothetical protein
MNNNNEAKVSGVSHDKYIALMNSITNMEDRLRWSELIYLLLNIVVLLFSVLFISSLIHKDDYYLTYTDLALIFSCLMIGMAIDAHWVASAMRAQLKLKLRYFQARAMERIFNSAGEYIFSDESAFFNPNIRELKSPDNKESLQYPMSGIARMDGFIGSAKPRYFSWMLPCLFIAVYWFIFFVVLTKV